MIIYLLQLCPLKSLNPSNFFLKVHLKKSEAIIYLMQILARKQTMTFIMSRKQVENQRTAMKMCHFPLDQAQFYVLLIISFISSIDEATSCLFIHYNLCANI